MNNLGYLYIQQGRSDAALPPLARAVELRGNVPVFQNNFGTALERSGHFVAAREAYQAALQADSTYEKAAVGLERVNGARRRVGYLVGGRARRSRGSSRREIEQWRTRAVTADSTTPADSIPPMARDSSVQ